jgi:hypothetical protein
MIESVAQVAGKQFGQAVKADKLCLSSKAFRCSSVMLVTRRYSAQSLAYSLDGMPSCATCSILDSQ